MPRLSGQISVRGGIMKRFLLLIAMLSALSGCAWVQGRTNVAPADIPAPDPSVVERDLSKPYVPEPYEALPQVGAQ